MTLLDRVLAHNARFVEDRGFEPYRTTALPDKRAVMLTCMDTRLVELLPAAMDLRQGDAKVLKNAGAIESVRMIRHHPLLPADVTVCGLLIDPETGALERVAV